MFNDLNDCSSSVFLLYKSGCIPPVRDDRCSQFCGGNDGTISLGLPSPQLVREELTPAHLEVLYI